MTKSEFPKVLAEYTCHRGGSVTYRVVEGESFFYLEKRAKDATGQLTWIPVEDTLKTERPNWLTADLVHLGLLAQNLQPKRTLSINDQVKFKLNPSGERIWKEYWEALGFPDHPVPETDQLWHLMQIFGAHISLSSEPPFDTRLGLL